MPWNGRSFRCGGGCTMVRDTLQPYESSRGRRPARVCEFCGCGVRDPAWSSLPPTRRRTQPSQDLEPQVRSLVAEHLGVGSDELAPEVSLADDLAADSLDLVELALVLEDEFGIAVSETVLEEVRTYGQLVEAVRMLVRRRDDEVASPAATEPAPVRVRLVPAPGRTAGDLERADWLTPYTAQTIAEDAVRSGPGAQLEVSVPPDLSDADLAAFYDQLASLDGRDISVRVRRDRGVPRPAQLLRPNAA